jgi:hypothetical protein
MKRHHIAAALAAAAAALGIVVSSAIGAGPAPGVLQGAPGIAVAGRAHVVAMPLQGNTRVQLIRDRDHAVLRTRLVAGKLGVPQTTLFGAVEGTWANGRRLMLSTSIYDNGTSTRFVVLDTRTLTTVRTIVLRGAFAFDALSPDGRRLYVTQFPNRLNGPIRYVVRSLAVATGQLDPDAIVDKTEPGEQMAGLPMVRTWSRSGTAFTLYNGLESHAFIHALDTVGRSARCIDLPWKGDAQNGLDRIRMSVDAAGILTLLQPGVGVLARVDTRTFAVDLVRAPA